MLFCKQKAMEKFQGFKPYIAMFDAGQLVPGQTIVDVRSIHLEYQVLPLDPQDRHPVYRVLGQYDIKHNVKNFLKNLEWYVKETSTEETN